MNKQEVLKKYFGYDAFRPMQAEIIDTILAKKNCLVLMPTGGGKSICFQVPAMVLDGITIVISPLIALMKDQVQALQANGISAAYINSSLLGGEIYDIEQGCLNGTIKLLYLAPEKIFSNNYIDFLKRLNISLFAIDEAHCVSSWGHDFRPEYTKLNILKEEFPDVPMMALTATADKVTRKDVLAQLAIPDAKIFISSFDRPNLSLTVLPGQKRMQRIQDFLLKHQNQSGIIYCLSRKGTESVAEGLQKMGFRAMCFHAGMSTKARSEVQDNFIKDDIQIIVATIAFGMGIDKSNVRWVIHYNMPKNVESFYQEIGRSGRDGLPSDTVFFYSYADFIAQKQMNLQAEITAERRELLEAKLDRMKQYAEAAICRRRILLSYFNEIVEKDCGNCDVCKNPRTKFDATVLAQKALSAISRTDQKIAMGLLIDILRGSLNKNVVERGYQTIKTFGVGKDLKNEVWADYIFQMLNSGVMDIAYDEAHAFKLNETSKKILKNEQQVSLVEFVPFEQRKQQQEIENQPVRTKKEIIRDALFERLRALRKQIADKLNMPPFVVFSDATLSDMSQKMPYNQPTMLNVSGVGELKYNQYGQVFINEILAYAKQEGIDLSARKVEITAPKTDKPAKGDTYNTTYELFQAGKTIEEIATERNFSPTTIFSHILKLYEEGKDIDLSTLVSEDDIFQVIQATKVLGIKKGDALRPIFEYLGEGFDYGKIRLALAVQEKSKQD